MPFNTTSALMLLSACSHLPAGSRGLEILHQSLEVTDELLHWMIALNAEDKHYDLLIIRELLAMKPAVRASHIDKFYQSAGFISHTVLDANPKLADIPLDFNLDLRRDRNFTESFDFVSNNGSTEHIFDQRAAFENIHNLCRVGGVMMHKVPMLDVLNIALYGCSPVFFHDLALANEYEILDLRLGNRWGHTVKVRLRPEDTPPVPDFNPALPPASESTWDELMGREVIDSSDLPAFLELHDFRGKTHLKNHDHPLSRTCHILLMLGSHFRPGNPGEIFNLALYRRTSNKPFRVPFQSKFLTELDSDDLRRRYEAQFET